MSDIDPLGQFSGVNFPPPMKPLRDQPVQPPVTPQVPAPPQQSDSMFKGTGIIDFFRSLFHRQSDLDDIMNQNGLRQPGVAPAAGGVRG